MATRLADAGHRVLAFDMNQNAADSLAGEHEGITAFRDLTDIVNAMKAPRVIWVMVPHQVVDQVIADLMAVGLQKGDVIVDGGNSSYKDSQRRGEALKDSGIMFVDCGTSGGIWGLSEGYSMMVGGSDQAISIIEPALKSLAPAEDRGWGHVGPMGSGHFVKMVHNGIEYGMMQAFAEGFDLMGAKEEFDLDNHQIARIWQHGSVVRSWLLDLTADALEKDADLSSLSDWMDDSGEGRWTVQEAIDLAVPAPVLSLALMMRFRSRQKPSFAGKVVNAMRAGFGGHAIRPAKKEK